MSGRYDPFLSVLLKNYLEFSKGAHCGVGLPATGSTRAHSKATTGSFLACVLTKLLFLYQGGEGPCRDRQVATQCCRYTGANNTPVHPVQLYFQVPLEVFDYIDSGRNPQLYTKDCMEKAHSKNEEVKGKIDAYRMFKARLLVELTHVFPKEMAVYRATRGDERGTQ